MLSPATWQSLTVPVPFHGRDSAAFAAMDVFIVI